MPDALPGMLPNDDDDDDAQPSQFILAWERHQICWLAYPVVQIKGAGVYCRTLVLIPIFDNVSYYEMSANPFLYSECIT